MANEASSCAAPEHTELYPPGRPNRGYLERLGEAVAGTIFPVLMVAIGVMAVSLAFSAERVWPTVENNSRRLRTVLMEGLRRHQPVLFVPPRIGAQDGVSPRCLGARERIICTSGRRKYLRGPRIPNRRDASRGGEAARFRSRCRMPSAPGRGSACAFWRRHRAAAKLPVGASAVDRHLRACQVARRWKGPDGAFCARARSVRCPRGSQEGPACCARWGYGPADRRLVADRTSPLGSKSPGVTGRSGDEGPERSSRSRRQGFGLACAPAGPPVQCQAAVPPQGHPVHLRTWRNGWCRQRRSADQP